MASAKIYSPDIEAKLSALVKISGENRDFFIEKLDGIEESEYETVLNDELFILEAPAIVQKIMDGTIETFPFPVPKVLSSTNL